MCSCVVPFIVNDHNTKLRKIRTVHHIELGLTIGLHPTVVTDKSSNSGPRSGIRGLQRAILMNRYVDGISPGCLYGYLIRIAEP